MNLGPHIESIGMAVGIGTFVAFLCLMLRAAEDNRDERRARRKLAGVGEGRSRASTRPAAPAPASNVRRVDPLVLSSKPITVVTAKTIAESTVDAEQLAADSVTAARVAAEKMP